MCWTVLSRDVTATRAGNVLPQLCSFGVDWKEAEIFGLSMLSKITPTCCFEHCVCQAPEEGYQSLFVTICHLSLYYHLLALCVTWRKAWAHCHHIHGFLTRYHFTDRIISSIPPSSIPRGSRRALVRIGKTRHIEPRSHVMVEPEDIWTFVFGSLY